jgi:hypothetical protein
MADQIGTTADVTVTSETPEVTGEVTQSVEVMEETADVTKPVEPWADLVDDIPNFSPEELTGEEAEEAAAEDDPTETDEEAADDKQETATASEPEAEVSEEPEPESQEDEPEQAKEPEGYVRLEALHEARGENRYLKSRIAQLEAEKAEISTKAAQPGWMDSFKKLSTEELRDLMADDPDAAVEYAEKLADYNTYEKEKEANAKAAAEAAEHNEIRVHTAFERIESAAPGIYSDKNVQAEIADFAESIGFTPDMFALTNPRNTISIEGGPPVALGEAAAGLVEMLAYLKSSVDSQFGSESKPSQKKTQAVAGGEPATTERQLPDIEAITAKVTEEVMKKVQGNVLDKLKSKSTDAGVKTLSDIQSSGNEEFSTSKILTQEQIEKLSPEQQRRYLSGVDG